MVNVEFEIMEKRLLLEQGRFKASVLPKENELVGKAWVSATNTFILTF